MLIYILLCCIVLVMEKPKDLEPTDSLNRENVLEEFRKNNIAIAMLLLTNPKDPKLPNLLEYDDYLSTYLSNLS